MNTDARKGKYTSPEGSKTWEYITVLTCSIMKFCVGCVIGWSSPSIGILMAEDSPISVTVSTVSTLVAITSVGYTLAPLINTVIVDKFGRKSSILLSALILLISWALITIATSVWELYVARFMAGAAVALYFCISPVYIGEVSSPNTRGAENSLTSAAFNVGILITFVVAPYLSLALMAGIFLIINVGFVIAFWFLPESPYFLVMKNRIDEAQEVLEKLRGKTDVSEELQTITEFLSKKQNKSTKSGSLKDIFTSYANFRALLSILLFIVMHHFGGYFTILVYGQLIFKSTKNVISDYVFNVVIGITQLISAVLTTFLVDEAGRKPLILVSGVSVAICNFVIGIYFYAKEYMYTDMLSFSWVPFVCSVILIFAFNCGLICLQVILMSEIFANEIKAVATCFIGVFGGLLGIVGFKHYIWIAITLNYGHSLPFLGYFVTVMICTAIIIRITPETKGKTFLEIQTELSK